MTETQAQFDVKACLAQLASSPGNVTVSRPTQIACWTKDGGQFHFGDTSGLATLSMPSPPLDLLAGYPQRYKPKDETAPSPVDTIVSGALQANSGLSQVDVITYRNNLNKLLLTPLEMKNEWAINACYMQGKLFLDITKIGYNSYPDQDKNNYIGYHFESICAGNAPGSVDVDPSGEYAIVVQLQLGAHQVLMGAEVDSHNPALPEDQGPAGGKPYVELKTYTIPQHRVQEERMYSQKHPRWWLQSYLAGVSTLMLGGRDKQGKLLKVHEVGVRHLPSLSAQAGQHWDPQQLLGFGEAALSWMKQQAAAAEGTTRMFWYDKNRCLIWDKPAKEDMAGPLAALLQGAGASG